MAVVVVCVLLTLAGLAAAARWGGTPFPAPPEGHPVRVYLWNLVSAVAAGLAAGVTMAGAGGRLVMRLLAATSPAAAQGRVTEAEETVGRISASGTFFFILFAAAFFGLATGVVYLLIRRWLPGGRLGGLTYGLLLLVVAATRLEPLRSDNPDFDIVGPSGVALAAFAALVVAHGMAVAALAARYATTLPLIARDPRVVVRYLPLLPTLLFIPFVVMAVVVGAAFVVVRSRTSLGDVFRSRNATLAGRAVLALVALVCVPGFVSAMSDIAGRGP